MVVRFDRTRLARSDSAYGAAMAVASIAFHVIVMSFMGFRSIAPPDRILLPDETVIPLYLTPRAPRVETTEPLRTPTARASARRGESPEPLHLRTPPIGVVETPGARPTPTDAVDARWRVRALAPGAAMPARLACIIDGVRRDAAACANWISDAPEDALTGRSVRVGERTLTPSEQRREAAFDGQAAYDEAMRLYRLGQGDHPGVRAMLKYQ